MEKYTIETKRKLIGMVESRKYSTGSAAKELGVSKSVAKRWMKMYEYHGYEGLLIKRSSYTGEFKKNVVEYMHANNLSIREASAKFGMPSHTTLLNWERIYYEEGADELLVERRGRSRESMNKKPKMDKKMKEDLIAEVQRLRAENAYLKKAIALAQDKRNLEKPKKRK